MLQCSRLLFPCFQFPASSSLLPVQPTLYEALSVHLAVSLLSCWYLPTVSFPKSIAFVQPYKINSVRITCLLPLLRNYIKPITRETHCQSPYGVNESLLNWGGEVERSPGLRICTRNNYRTIWQKKKLDLLFLFCAGLIRSLLSCTSITDECRRIQGLEKIAK